MIIDFTVENFRSIKDPVTLSFIAQKTPKRERKGKRHVTRPPDDEIAQPRPVEGRDFSLLPVAGIFGANASGRRHSRNRRLRIHVGR